MTRVKAAKVWRKASADALLRDSLSRELAISPVTAQILLNRGIRGVAEGSEFLHGGAELLGDPAGLLGMEAAVARIRQAVVAKEKITIYGDYDVDGITATSLLLRVLNRLGANAGYYIPERQNEGYGLNSAALEQLYASGTGLMITVDCGISATAEIAAFSGRLDIIVTDHHEPPEELPPAYAIINPKQPGCAYPDKNLAGVGVAFKLCQALWREFHGPEPVFLDYLDLVAVGTVADVVPLMGENRVIVKLGLAELGATRNAGLGALMAVAGIAGAAMDTGKVGFILGPRLNAAGRISHAAAGVELLTTDDSAVAERLAAELNDENTRRQEVERELLAIAEKMLDGVDLNDQKVLVLAGPDWHPGVIGIVASRLVERYYRPVVLISVREGIGKGSCRSIPGFDMYRALAECGDVLIQYGGHQQAAGLSVAESNIAALREKLNALAREWLSDEDYHPVLKLDSQVALAEISAALLEQLACLAPHGMGNPTPVLYTEELAVTGVRPVGQEGRHLKLKVSGGGAKGDVIAWDMGALAERLSGETAVDLAFSPEYNEWQGQRTIQLRAHDVRVRAGEEASAAFRDARHTADRLAYLCQLLGGGRAAVYVADRRQVVATVRELRARLGAREGIAGSYPAMAPGRRRYAQAALASGSLSCLVWAGELPPVAGFGEIVLASPPDSWRTLAGWCRQAASSPDPVRLHLLFGKADVEYRASRFREDFPDRTGIGWLYYVLKQLAAVSPLPDLRPEELAEKVKQAGRVTLSRAGVESALTVLEELNLITRQGGIALEPEPRHKLDIAASPAFCRSTRAREEYEAFAGELLRLPAKDVDKKVSKLMQIIN